MGNQIIALKYKTNGVVTIGISIPGFIFLCGFTPNDQITGSVPVQSANDVQQSRFAAAGLPQDSDELRSAELDADAFQSADHTVVYFEVIHF